MTPTQKQAFKSTEQNRATRQIHVGAKDWTKGRLLKELCWENWACTADECS